jgi:hypothetical protein
LGYSPPSRSFDDAIDVGIRVPTNRFLKQNYTSKRVYL